MLQQNRKMSRSLNVLANCALFLLFAYFGLVAYQNWKEANQEQIQEMDSIGLLMAKSLEVFLQSEQSGLQTLAEALSRAPGGPSNRQSAQRLLDEYAQHRPYLVVAFVADMKGQMLTRSGDGVQDNLPFIGDQPSFQDFLREYPGHAGAYVGRPQIGKISKTWNFSIRLVMKDAAGHPIANVNAVIPTEFLIKLWQDMPVIQHRTLGLLRHDGYLLGRHPLPGHAQLSEVLGQPRNGALFQYLQSHGFPKSGVVIGPNMLADGDEFINVFHRLEAFPVTVFVAESTKVVKHAWLRATGETFALLFLLGALIKLAARTLSERQQAWESEKEQSDALLRASESEQRQLIDQLMTGLVIHDAEGVVLRCNPEASRLLGLTIEQMQGKDLIDPSWQFLKEDGSTMPVSDYPVSKVLSTHLPQKEQIVGILHPGKTDALWVLCRADPGWREDGCLERIVVSFIDITQLLRLRHEVTDKEKVFRSLFDNSMDAVMLTRPNGDVVSANAAACHLFGMSSAEICASGRTSLVDADDPRLANLLKLRAISGKARGELTMKRGDGSRFQAEVTSSVYQTSDGQFCTAMIVRDISDRVAAQKQMESMNATLLKANEQLVEMAHYDPLTHMPNRVLLADRLQQAIVQSSRHKRMIGVAFIDLDGFKEINDLHGHSVGDQLLVAVARRFTAAMREGDTLARLGGDEFVAVMADLADAHDIEPLLNRMLGVVAEPLQIENHEIRITASIGVTIYPTDASEAELLLRHADQAMYQAKQAGKNRYHLFDVANDTALRSRRESVNAIVEAFQRDEFLLHYQPQVNMRTNEAVGVEALVRWAHPQRGLVPPLHFLPLIEDSEFAVMMGNRIIDMALAQMDQWRQAGIMLSVSVNLFPRQVQETDFVRSVQALLRKYPLVDPHRLKFEIVETNALQDLVKVSEIMRSFTELGIEFALDDFGTGYSSLTYLRKLPASLLKIDQSFVRDMLEDPNDLAIVQGVIGLAHAFGREVIAEGVETAEHGQRLMQLGCDLAQGYGIARPMSAAKLEQWLLDGRTPLHIDAMTTAASE